MRESYARSDKGFSLVEILIVVVVIGIIAALAMPYLQKGILASENSNVFASLRTISSTQINYYSQNNRFGRLTELNNITGGALGAQSGNDIRRGKYLLSMTPDPPTDSDLRNGFTVTATRNIASEGVIYKWEITEAGNINQILP